MASEATGEQEMLLLVRRAQAGDVHAFARLAAEHQASLARFCRRLMGDAASGEDLAQDTLLRAQQSIGRLGEPYRFGPWLLGIAANLAKKAWRAEARRPLSLESLVSAYPHVPWDESLTAVPSPEQISEEAEESRLLAEAIGALPAALSRVVVLHYLNGLNYAEVAGALALPVSTVKGRLFESRARLRRQLASGAAPPAPVQTRAIRTKLALGRARHQGEAHDLPAQHTTHTKGDRMPMAQRTGPHLRVEVHLDSMIDEALRFVTTRWPRANPIDSLQDLGSVRNRFIPIPILEQMVLDGVTRREDIADFVGAMFDPQHFDVI